MVDSGGRVHVALGKGLKKGKMILDWVFNNLRGVEIVILHVHRPPKLIPMQIGGWFPINQATPEEAEKYITKKRIETNRVLSTFLNLCAKQKVPATELVIEADDIDRGIVYLVGQHQIKRIILGLRSIKEQPVLEKGLLSCQIWLIRNGKLIFTRAPFLPPISGDFTSSENPGSSASASNDSGGSSDFQSDQSLLELQSQAADVSPRKPSGLEREEEEEESDDDFIEYSLREIEEASAKWLVQSGEFEMMR